MLCWRLLLFHFHALAEAGKFTTDPNHLHSPYRHVIQHSLDYLLDRARLGDPVRCFRIRDNLSLARLCWDILSSRPRTETLEIGPLGRSHLERKN